MFSWNGIRQKFKKSKSDKSKSMFFDCSTFRFFFFPLAFRLFDISVFRFFFFPLDSQRFKFCTFSCACSAGKASAKNSNNQKVKNQKVWFSTFRFFFFPLDSQRFKFCTFSWACSVGTASAKNSNNQKVKNQKVCFSTFRNSQRHLSTFRLFVFRLFEIDLAYFPPGALQHIFPQRNAGRGQEKRVFPNETVLIHFWESFTHLFNSHSDLTFRSLWDYCHYAQPSSYMILNYTPPDSLEAIVTFKSIIYASWIWLTTSYMIQPTKLCSHETWWWHDEDMTNINHIEHAQSKPNSVWERNQRNWS